MKKVILLLAVAVMSMGTSLAAGTGYVSYQKILANYAPARKAVQELDQKGLDIKQYIMQQELALLKTSDANKKAVQQKAIKDLRAKEEALLKLRKEKELELTKSIVTAVDRVRAEKKLDIILDSTSVLSGGIDCTADVLKHLNSSK